MVIAVPEVRHLQLEDGDEFLILACDGIWDVLSNQEVISTPSSVSCWHKCFLVPAMSGCSSGTVAYSSATWRALFASEVIRLYADAGLPVGGRLCAQAPGEAHDAAGHLRGHVRPLPGARHPGAFPGLFEGFRSCWSEMRYMDASILEPRALSRDASFLEPLARRPYVVSYMSVVARLHAAPVRAEHTALLTLGAAHAGVRQGLRQHERSGGGAEALLPLHQGGA